MPRTEPPIKIAASKRRWTNERSSFATGQAADLFLTMDKGEEKLCRHLDTEKYPIDSLSRNSHLKERITANRRNILVRFNLTQANPVPEVNDSGNVVYTRDAKGIHSVALGRQCDNYSPQNQGKRVVRRLRLQQSQTGGESKIIIPIQKRSKVCQE